MVFPVVMYGCESWTVKKAECRRIDAFELWYWRRLLRVPWTARRSNQSILKEINLGCSLEGMMLKLKLQYFGHLMQRVEDSDARRDWGQEEKRTTEDEMAGWHHWLDGCEFEWTPGVGDGQGGLACCNSWGHKDSDKQLNWTKLSDSAHTFPFLAKIFPVKFCPQGTFLYLFHLILIPWTNGMYFKTANPSMHCFLAFTCKSLHTSQETTSHSPSFQMVYKWCGV